MHDIFELVSGYQRFRSGRYVEQANLYDKLGKTGQSPKVMVIACCDSRVDPAVIFDAGPGELFVVRNVANLVPPYNPNGDYHGTSAALEFATKGLGVECILVMGHAKCGGITAFIEGQYTQQSDYDFIGKWVGLLDEAQCRHDDGAEGLTDERQKDVEHSSIRLSLKNLETFPFVRTRIEEGRLSLRGAYFDIAEGELLSMDPKTEDFSSVGW